MCECACVCMRVRAHLCARVCSKACVRVCVKGSVSGCGVQGQQTTVCCLCLSRVRMPWCVVARTLLPPRLLPSQDALLRSILGVVVTHYRQLLVCLCVCGGVRPSSGLPDQAMCVCVSVCVSSSIRDYLRPHLLLPPQDALLRSMLSVFGGHPLLAVAGLRARVCVCVLSTAELCVTRPGHVCVSSSINDRLWPHPTAAATGCVTALHTERGSHLLPSAAGRPGGGGGPRP